MDKGHQLTDKQLLQVEKRLAKEYEQAQKEMQKKLKKQMAKYDKELKAKEKLLKAGKLDPSDFMDWKMGQLMRSSWMWDMIDDYTNESIKANKRASEIINGNLKEAYAENHNYGTYQVEKAVKADTAYTLYNKDTVKNLQIGTKINVAKDRAWHNRKIQSALTQGILQGESMDKIAGRLGRIGIMDENAAIRNARTMITAAQNEGRLDAYERAADMGLKLKKTWVATLDDRTRESHAELDGETVALDEAFSNGLMYPADPSGDPAEVYNCRCTMITQLDGFERDVTDLGLRPAEIGSYEDWKASRIARKNLDDKLNDLAGHKYSNIWKDTVTPADYAAKKAGIDAKKQYFDDQIALAKKNGWAGKEAKFKALKADLNKFEKEGKQYEAYLARQNALLSKGAKKSAGGFDASALTQARKNAALDFSSRREADAALRPLLDKQWDGMTEHEKYGIWEYTHNSHPINKPLSGYANGSWDRSDFKGFGNVPWSTEDNWRRLTSKDFINKFGKNGTSNVDYKRTIADLTKAIDKCTFDKDMWLVRGSDINGLAGMFEGGGFSFNTMKKMLGSASEADLKTALVGQTCKNNAFTSTGIARDAGFSGDVKYRIFAPKGTKGVYAEPTSFFGDTIDMKERLYKKGEAYKDVGSEAEIILQRGTQFRVTDIRKDRWGDIEIDMEIVEQPDYFKTGLEETFNNGATKHKF